MPISKRTIPKRKKPPKLHPKVARHHKECKRLYNRLQKADDNSIQGIMLAVDARMDRPPVADTYEYTQRLLNSFDATIYTLQINNEAGRSNFQVSLRWTDRQKQPKPGQPHPTLTTVKYSPSLLRSAILAYIELCKYAGKFL